MDQPTLTVPPIAETKVPVEKKTNRFLKRLPRIAAVAGSLTAFTGITFLASAYGARAGVAGTQVAVYLDKDAVKKAFEAVNDLPKPNPTK